MTSPLEPTRPDDEALEEPTEGHVDVDSATTVDRSGPDLTETLSGIGGAAAGKPAGFLAGAGLTDRSQPAEGGREEGSAADGVSEDELKARQEEHGAP